MKLIGLGSEFAGGVVTWISRDGVTVKVGVNTKTIPLSDAEKMV